MESGRNDESLTPSVPKIVVTEPTPLNLGRGNISQVTKPQDNQLIQSSSTEIQSSETTKQTAPGSSTVVEGPTPKATESESSGAFSPVPDCAQCIVPVDEPPRELEIETDAETYADHSELTEDTLRMAPNWWYRCRDMYSVYYNCSNFLVESKYLLPLQFLLLALPISAGFMAARYMDDCSMSVATPILMFMMGIVGTIVILCRISLILGKFILPSYRGMGILRTTIIFCNLCLITLLCTEMLSFLRISPSFEVGSPNYCNPVFYQFTYWVNLATVLLIIILLILHAPACTLESMRGDDQVPS